MLAWLALVALTLLPTFTRIAGAATAGGWSEVCTVQGVRWLAPDGALSERGPAWQSAAHGEHCPLCAGGVAAPPPPPSASMATPTADADWVAPLFLHAPARPFAWAHAPPRAPPLHA